VNPLTRQPIKGRKFGGGIRFGEMERDALLAHGAAYLLHDRLHACSDYAVQEVCTACGSLLAPTAAPPPAAAAFLGKAGSYGEGTGVQLLLAVVDSFVHPLSCDICSRTAYTASLCCCCFCRPERWWEGQLPPVCQQSSGGAGGPALRVQVLGHGVGRYEHQTIFAD